MMVHSKSHDAWWRKISPNMLLVAGFLWGIVVGACLLASPWANVNGQWRDPLTSVFMATSGVCVTGLSVIDVAGELTRFGQIVLLVLVQLGGLGLTTFGTFFLVVAGRRLSVQSEFALMNAYGVEEVKGIRSLIVWIIAFTLIFEGLGALVFWSQYMYRLPEGMPVLTANEAWYYAVFHAVMAFCNAGFTLHPNSIVAWQTNMVFTGMTGLLIFCGGIGFLVSYNLFTIKFWRRNLKTRGRLSLHTKISLVASLALLVIGIILFFVLERNSAFRAMSWQDACSGALFQSVTSRTSGFSIVPTESLREISRFVHGLLMFIGGSTGSAAGGVKTTTFAVMICTVIALCRGRRKTIIFSRTVPENIVRESLVIFFLHLSLICVAFGALLYTESQVNAPDSSRLLFEVVSATSTTGLSVGNTTATLSELGRCVIIACMFFGRLGAMTIVLLIGNREEVLRIQHPEEEIVVG